MTRPPTAQNNPFLRLKARSVVIGAYVIATLIVGLGYGLLARAGLVPAVGEDPIAMPLLNSLIFLAMAGVVLRAGMAQGLKFRCLFGPQRLPKFSWFYAGLLVASLIIFSLGSFSVFFYLLSLIFPEYAMKVLVNTDILGGSGSRYPQLYDGIMLFLLLVCAPVIEELIFRGILLQRWATRWGMPWGLLLSSVLFGSLHFNNPLGLTVFGVVMALLYVRTRNLAVPMICHGLNNLAAIAIEKLSQSSSAATPLTLADMQTYWWTGFILMGVSAPLLLRFIWMSWPKAEDPIPYLTNVHISEGEKP